MAKKKTIKYLENGEYHDATVKDVGVIEELKTESKDNLVEAINEIFLGGGKGFSDLQQKVNESAEAAQNAQQATNNLQQKLDEVAQNVGLSDEEARKIINQAVEDAKRAQAEALQAYKEAQKELDDSIAQFMEEQKAINQELEQAKDSIQEDIEQKNAEVEQINEVIESTKSDLTATSARLASVRNDLSNAQMDWGKVRQEITNINGKLASKMSNTDFDEYKERIERNETEITQTKNELQSKATKQDLDVLTGTVTTQGSSITQLAGKIEQKVSKDTLANDIDDFQVKKANIFTGTREFMGWEFSDKALGRVNDDIYNHAKVAELHNGSNLSITVNGLEVGKTYSVSIFAKTSANSNTSGVKVTVDNGKSYSGLMRTVYTPHDTKVTTNWQRYYATIVASATTMKFVFDRSGITSDITLYLNRPKLEVGETVYAWEDNAQDIYKRVEHTEAQFDVYNDQISGIVKRQTETDKKIENVSSTFTQRADGIEANSKKYTNDKVTGLTEEFSGKLRATSTQLSTEYEKQTNAKIGALSDGGSNLILNSSFLVTDDNGNATLENWRDTSSKVRLTNPNGLDGTWIKVNRATTGTALGARSNYFPVKQGKLVVGVDVALDGTGNISPYVLRIEYYDASNNRVNYEDITLQKLGLSASQITKSGSNFRYARGVYKTSNDRSDVAKACIVVPETITGYDMYLTNFFAKFSDVNDGTYEVNPLDQQASLIKQRTKIEQDSEKINLLNTQTEKLGNDIKATNTSIGVLKGEINLKASQSTVNDLTNRVSKNEADIKVFPDKIKSEVRGVSKKIDGVSDKVDNMQVGGTNLLKDSLVPLTASDVWIADGVSSQVLNDYVRIRGMGDNNRIYQPFSNNGLNADGYYSISFWASNDGNGEEFDVQVGAWNSLQTVHITGSTLKLYKLENVWLGGNPTFSFVAPFGKVVRLKKIKLEKGNKATDWTPSPEDLQEGINIATTKATQTDTKFERMLNQIQYNDSTGEIGKYEHKITELSNGTQEKISAIQLDNDKKLQSATQTLTNKIGDLESTVRTNTTNIGQYRQEMTNSAKELSTKFTSVQNDISSVSNRLDNLSVGGTNLAKHTSNTLTNRMQVSEWVYVASSGNTANFNLDNYKGQTLTMRAWIDKPTVDAHLQVWTNSSNNGYDVGNTIKAGQSGYSSLTFKVPTSFTEWNISIGNGKVAELAYKEFKVEKGTIATDWTPSPEDLQEGINIATTKATQTDTKFERMLNQIQYNDSTGEIGKYEHKITELSNGTQEKISAITKRGSNMIIKSNFDDGTDVGGWYNASGAGYSSELYRTTTTPKPDEMSSNYCIALGGRDVLEDGNIFPVVAGTKYHISAWAYTSQKYQGKVGLFLGNSTNSSARNWIGVTVPKDSQNRWIKIKGTVTIPNGYNKAQPWLQVEKNGSNNEKIYFADMNISRVDDNAIEMNETITTKIGDLEKTIRTNTTNIGQYRQEMTNSAKEWSTKFTSYQNLMQNDISSAAETARTNAKNDAISAIKGDSQWQSMGKIVTNASFLQNADGFAQEVARTATPMIKGGGVNLLKDSLVPLTASDIWINNSVSNQIVDDYVRIRGIGDNNRIYQSFSNNGLNADGYYSISFWASNDGNNEEFDVQVGTWSSLQTVRITGSTLQLYKLENVWLGGNPSFSFVAPFGKVVRLKKIKLEKGAIATDWTPSPEDLATKLQLNDISSRTQFLQDDKQFLLRVQQVGGATQADVNSANSKIGDLSTRVKNTEVAITSGGVTINGNTKINGELQAQNMVLKGKSSTMALNGDSGVAISDNTGKFGMRLTGAKLNFDLMFNNDLEKLGGIIATKNSASNNVNGMHLYVTPLQTLGKPYGGDEIGIGKQTALSGSGNIQSAMIYNATGVSKGEGFHWYKPSYLETTEGRTIRVSNAHDPLIWRALKWGASTQGDYYQPFLSLGYNDDTVGDSGIGFYWNSVKLAGSVDMSDARIWMKDAEANIRFGWTSWSDWTGKIPSMYRTEWGKTQSTGGIGFGGDGNVILFGGNRRWDMNHH